MGGDHYFTSTPESSFRPKSISVMLAGATRNLTTAGGVFSPDRLDQGTQVLLDYVPEPPATGNILDLGCGWGPIGLTAALESPESTVWAVDVNDRARELVRLNADAVGVTNIRTARPEDVPDDIRFSAIWSNPPIRVGKKVLHDMLLSWLPRLEQGSDAYLVVQRNLGSDSLHRWLEDELPANFCVSRTATSKGYRLLRVRSGSAQNSVVSHSVTE
ncbi:methyltransferase [Klugiella xanthotipulae]|uniref:16S rRNA m(2)G 1207 methyltransferase n=1 Tax=Klugiella xanthotipulae TaxID=244735 RepID=A0A543HXQ3_9MICO|nr:methyltransferase [Klugiella xanthotipulae]TQM63138.1 16S rRNA m(2)G 1207 methyltransferase [Klugiella xanthotipulae]